MKKSLLLMLFTVVVLAFSPVALAQSEGSKANMDEETTLTGCLTSPSEGNLVLTLEDGTEVKVTGSSDLEAHVTHKVALTGKWKKKDNGKVFAVSTMKHISTDCDA